LHSYRRSTDDYRQQLKWLLSGGGLGVVGLMLEFSLNGSSSQLLRAVGNIGLLASLIALPISLGISILRYRLYEIDRLISRTISYLIVTGVLVGVFGGLAVLTTRVLPFSSSPVAVAVSTLATAALSIRSGVVCDISLTGASTVPAMMPKQSSRRSPPAAGGRWILTRCAATSFTPSAERFSPPTPLFGSSRPTRAGGRNVFGTVRF